MTKQFVKLKERILQPWRAMTAIDFLTFFEVIVRSTIEILLTQYLGKNVAPQQKLNQIQLC